MKARWIPCLPAENRYNTTMETMTLADFEQAAEVERKEKLDKRHGTPPPRRGPCRRCGQNKPINRLMLCYPCWVKTQLEDKAGWREGMPHPGWCGCSLPEHARKSDGN